MYSAEVAAAHVRWDTGVVTVIVREPRRGVGA